MSWQIYTGDHASSKVACICCNIERINEKQHNHTLVIRSSKSRTRSISSSSSSSSSSSNSSSSSSSSCCCCSSSSSSEQEAGRSSIKHSESEACR